MGVTLEKKLLNEVSKKINNKEVYWGEVISFSWLVWCFFEILTLKNNKEVYWGGFLSLRRKLSEKYLKQFIEENEKSEWTDNGPLLIDNEEEDGVVWGADLNNNEDNNTRLFGDTESQDWFDNSSKCYLCW